MRTAKSATIDGEAAKEAESLLVASFSSEHLRSLKRRYSKRESWITARNRIIRALGKEDSAYDLAEVYKAKRMYDCHLSLAGDDEFLFRENIAKIDRAYPVRADFIKRDIERELRNTASRGSRVRCAESILTYGTCEGRRQVQTICPCLQGSAAQDA